ncbi:MAG: LPS export ABC transporter permease LptG [Burkholderiales bacterium]|nr:LPS export ABC transporter permease LptG [Burkholderiales bacterium]
MPTLERYLARQIVGAVAFVLAGFLALFAFFDLIGELKDLGHGAYHLREIFLVVALWVPGHAYELMPVAVLIGTLYVLAHLSSNSEYTAMRAAGLSPARAARALAKIGVAFAAATFAIGEWIAPHTEQAAQQTRMRAMHSLIGQGLESGLWFKDGQTFINVREARDPAALKGVRIYEFDGARRLRAVSEAQRALYAGEGLWRLDQVVQTRLEDDGPRVARFASLEWRSAVTPDMLRVLIVHPERMSAWTLAKYIRHLADNRQKTERYEIALWKKLFYPLAAFVMMALALPFAYLHARSGMVGLKVFLGIMLGIAFHMLNGLLSHVGLIQRWPPLAAAALPGALFLATAALMMWWIERVRPVWVRLRAALLAR